MYMYDVESSLNIAFYYSLHSPYLSDEENRQLYGKCNHENGHGHNYKRKWHLTITLFICKM